MSERLSTFRANNEVAVHVADCAAAEQFYVHVMGCSVVAREPEMITLASGALRLYLVRDAAPVHEVLVPSFDVNDRAAALATLQAAGCTLVPVGPHAPDEHYLRDPFGALFDVVERRSAPAIEERRAGQTRLMTFSGSLRSGSSNSALLNAAAQLAPRDVRVTPFDGLAALPAFNPDDEMGDAPIPHAVMAWRTALANADAVLISSPEYAHGVPGVLKNALDWVVGSGEFVGKPVGVLNASTASQYAHPQILETLSVMSAALVADACQVVNIPRRGVTVESLLADADVSRALQLAVAALVASAHI